MLVLYRHSEPRTPVTTPREVIENPLKQVQDDIQNESFQPATSSTIPSSDTKKGADSKLIQKEAIETGSVSVQPFSIPLSAFLKSR